MTPGIWGIQAQLCEVIFGLVMPGLSTVADNSVPVRVRLTTSLKDLTISVFGQLKPCERSGPNLTPTPSEPYTALKPADKGTHVEDLVARTPGCDPPS